MKYYVIYYWKGVAGIRVTDGFPSRELAYNWVRQNEENIDSYQIKESSL